jgi:hypothetical protein
MLVGVVARQHKKVLTLSELSSIPPLEHCMRRGCGHSSLCTSLP